MKATFLRRVVWYESIFEEGRSYEIDDMVYAKLLRQNIVRKAVEDTRGVEQPEKPYEASVKPVATPVEPLPTHKPKRK